MRPASCWRAASAPGGGPPGGGAYADDTGRRGSRQAGVPARIGGGWKPDSPGGFTSGPRTYIIVARERIGAGSRAPRGGGGSRRRVLTGGAPGVRLFVLDAGWSSLV